MVDFSLSGLWLKLLIEGLMKDYDTKRELACLFTRNYPAIVRDHIADDQVRLLSSLVLRSRPCFFYRSRSRAIGAPPALTPHQQNNIPNSPEKLSPCRTFTYNTPSPPPLLLPHLQYIYNPPPLCCTLLEIKLMTEKRRSCFLD